MNLCWTYFYGHKTYKPRLKLDLGDLENGELLFHGSEVSVWEDEKALDGWGWWIHNIMHLNMAGMVNFMFYVFDHNKKS